LARAATTKRPGPNFLKPIKPARER